MKVLSEENIISRVREIEFQPLEFENWREKSSFTQKANKINFKLDGAVDIVWENKSYKFIVEIKSHGSPKMTEEAIYQLKNQLSEFGGAENYYPLLIAPYLSEARFERLMSEKISGLDLSGNGLIYVPGEIFVYRCGAKNKFPSGAPIKNVFLGTSSLVGRVFLAKAEFKTVGEVLDEIKRRSGKTTYPTVSKVLKSLEEDLIIARELNAIQLIDGKRLLKSLSENYRPPKIRKVVKGKAENLASTLGQMSENAVRRDLRFAVNEPQRYVAMPSTSAALKIYVENVKAVLENVEFSENERFPNVEFVETRESTVYFDRQWNSSENAYFTSPVQVYLELAGGGKREQEMAETVADGILNSKY